MSPGRWVLTVAFSPDGKLLDSVDAKHQLQLWDTETERALLAIKTAAVGSDRVTFSLDGTLLATEETNTIRLRQAPSFELTREPITGMHPRFAPDSAELVYFRAKGEKGGVHWLNLKTGKERVWPGEGNSPFAMALSRDGRRVVLSERHRVLMAGPEDGTNRFVEIGRHSEIGGVSGLSFSPNGHFLASAGWDGAVHLWNRSGHGYHRRIFLREYCAIGLFGSN